MADEVEFWAHTPRQDDPAAKPQSMREHMTNVADLAVRFAEPFKAEELARWSAWLHDVGKYSKEFQQYLRDCHDYDTGRRSQKPKPGSAEHKCAGTKLAGELLPLLILHKPLSACVLGHHGGLNANAHTIIAVATAMEERPEQIAVSIERALADYPELRQMPPDPRSLPCLANLPQNREARERYFEMLTRFVFSCLVDADSLDTEQHFSGSRPAWPLLTDKLTRWQNRLEARQRRDQRKQPDTTVNQVRRQVYEDCLRAASQEAGVFALTVPTGGGKTRSSLAFALHHAQANQLCRIIYAAPYTSIIDQTAKAFRDILGRRGILEHHSAVDVRTQQQPTKPGESQTETGQEQQRRSASENWEAPLVVTTTVQLFESLFSNQTSRCRKLHHVARSVIILDEVQTLPPHLLIPLMDGLKTLVERFGVSVVLCTATQPALNSRAPYFQDAGLPDPYPIVPDAPRHFKALRRVTYAPIRLEQWTWERTALEMKAKRISVLAVVNTKKDAIALRDALKDLDAQSDVRHLSTLLCLAHRRKVLAGVQAALEAERNAGGSPVYLVSTQVIEAGVDIDFPHVFRAKASLDRIVQAAGRCNREGRRLRDDAHVVVFDPQDGSSPPGDYRTALETAWNLIAGKNFDFDDPTQMTAYFHLFYSKLREKGLDKKQVQADRAKWDFPAVASKVRLINDDTVPVLVPYHQGKVEGAELTEQEFNNLVDSIRDRAKKRKGMSRDLWQRIQSLSVAVFRTEAEKLGATLVEALIPHPSTGDAPDLWLWHGLYDPVLGIGKKVSDPSDGNV